MLYIFRDLYTRYPSESKGSVEEMRFVAMRHHTKEQAKEGEKETKAPEERLVTKCEPTVDGYLRFLVDKTKKEDSTTDSSTLTLRFPFSFLFSNNQPKENGFSTTDPYTARTRHRLMLLILKISLVLIVVVALAGSFWWTVSISSSSRGHVYHNYRRLQEQLVSDLWDIGEISLGANRWKELEYCNLEAENYVPCFNVTENLALGYANGDENDRFCGPGSKLDCLVLPPGMYRVPLRWPTGKDVIWYNNVKITAQEALSSGSITNRMMMMDEDQISFHSASLMSDEVEDYSHQIAQMIGIKKDNFIEAGVRTVLDIGCGYGSFGDA